MRSSLPTLFPWRLWKAEGSGGTPPDPMLGNQPAELTWLRLTRAESGFTQSCVEARTSGSGKARFCTSASRPACRAGQVPAVNLPGGMPAKNLLTATLPNEFPFPPLHPYIDGRRCCTLVLTDFSGKI